MTADDKKLMTSIIKKHRNLWTWIAEQCRSQKQLVKRWSYFYDNPEFEEGAINQDETIPDHMCYACEFGVEFSLTLKCNACPFDWGSKIMMAPCCHKTDKHTDDGLSAMFDNLGDKDWEKGAELADKIANLKLTKQYKRLLGDV